MSVTSVAPVRIDGVAAPPAGGLGKGSTLLRFVASSAGANAAILLGTALALRWVEPAAMGVWQTLLLASSYLIVVRFGLISGLGRELPFAIGRGDRERAASIAATSVFYNGLCSLVVGLAFLCAVPFFWSAGAQWRIALPAMAVYSAASFYLSYLQATFRSDRDFDRLAQIQMAQAGLALLLPLSVWMFGFAGLCVHSALQIVAITALAHAYRPFRMRPRFERVMAWQLVTIGFPLFLAGYLQTVASGFDRVILLWHGSVATVGYYAPAMAVMGAMAIVPGALSTYVYPRMSHALGAGQQRAVLGAMARRAALLSFAASLPIAVIGWLAVPTLTTQFFPQYSASIASIRWSLFAGLFWSFTPAPTAIGSLKEWRLLSVYVGLLLVARWTLPWLFAGLMDPLEGVAVGNLLAGMLLAAVVMLLLARATRSGGRVAPAQEAA